MAALALISESVRMARLTEVARVILLLTLEKVSIGTVGWPLFGIIWNLFVVWSRFTLDPSESLTDSSWALTVPPR